MKITELKIQNLVRYKKQTYSLTEVFQHENAEYYVKISNSKSCVCIPAKLIKPVRINESWLLKFGFTKTYDSEHILRFERRQEFLKYDIDLHNTHFLTGLKLYGNNVNCVCVHQFQNLFCFLFGREPM
ncbi:protease II [Chryseobacterium ginsenosidimutans]|nr:protease II [Chryseobacterium ginsenosidimutans]